MFVTWPFTSFTCQEDVHDGHVHYRTWTNGRTGLLIGCQNRQIKKKGNQNKNPKKKNFKMSNLPRTGRGFEGKKLFLINNISAQIPVSPSVWSILLAKKWRKKGEENKNGSRTAGARGWNVGMSDSWVQQWKYNLRVPGMSLMPG